MYCPKCGNVTNEKLNYCNTCGGKLTNNGDDSPRLVFMSMIISLTVVSIIGLGSVIGLIAMLLSRGVKDELIVMLVGGYLLTFFAIIFIIGRQVSKLIDGKLLNNTQNAEVIFPPRLSVPNTAQLEEAKQQPFSVVENTTRTFDEAFVKRN